MPYKDPEVYRLYKQEYGKMRKARVNALKENKPCGTVYPSYVLQRDHIGTDKSFNISNGKSKPFEEVLAEIEKCELVCANCHAERTHQRSLQKQFNTGV